MSALSLSSSKRGRAVRSDLLDVSIPERVERNVVETASPSIMPAVVCMLWGVRMRATPRLAEDVFFCVSEGYGIFLDLKSDAYSAVRLRGQGRDLTVNDNRASCISVRLSDHHDELVEAGLLVFSERGRALDAFRDIARPESHVLGPNAGRLFGEVRDAGTGVRIRFRELFAFFLACRRASSWLRRWSMCELVHHLRERRARVGTRLQAGCAVQNCEGLKRETAIFRKLRPLYPRAYLCLFEAVALLNYLASRGHFPACIFAVQADPFGAHCWLQADDALLNESLEYAGRFTPIMSI